jgi:single-strand selective monofunctional uracil DNA glycosylase
MSLSTQVLDAADQLRKSLRGLKFSEPVTHVYNPLEYAWKAHSTFVNRYGDSKKRVLFLGMNPGPFGMAQTGVPFGEISAVRDWMGISEDVDRPKHEHPKRPILGFDCKRSEVSGKRLWGWVAQQFGTPESFFKECYVVNYCPLIFLEESGRNRTPDKVPNTEMAPVHAACDAHLRRIIDLLDPEWLVGVGGFAESKFQAIIRPGDKATVARIPHPSPANPAANKDWAGAAKKELIAAGIWKWKL